MMLFVAQQMGSFQDDKFVDVVCVYNIPNLRLFFFVLGCNDRAKTLPYTYIEPMALLMIENGLWLNSTQILLIFTDFLTTILSPCKGLIRLG